jgi:hypothetical protein
VYLRVRACVRVRECVCVRVRACVCVRVSFKMLAEDKKVFCFFILRKFGLVFEHFKTDTVQKLHRTYWVNITTIFTTSNNFPNIEPEKQNDHCIHQLPEHSNISPFCDTLYLQFCTILTTGSIYYYIQNYPSGL